MRFDHPAQQIVLQDYIDDGEARLARLEQQIEDLLPSWSMAPVVEAVQAMRGVGLIVAVTVVAEVGDFSRFANCDELQSSGVWIAIISLFSTTLNETIRVLKTGLFATEPQSSASNHII